MNLSQENNNIVSLWKSSAIKVDDDHTILMVYYFHTERDSNNKFIRDKNFYKCCGKIDTNENWKKLSLDILNNNPASTFHTSSLGIDDDYEVYYSRKFQNNADMSRWLNNKIFRKIITKDEFNTANEAANVKEKYIINLDEVINANGSWVCKFREKKTTPRKKKTVIM